MFLTCTNRSMEFSTKSEIRETLLGNEPTLTAVRWES